ncbi:hypothetical protein BC936DRAFT_147724 [Jimgerdemannia flammicorona]|uniref:DNA topoisomerase (ATP-hydrolyzing) n=1 Tax=Jimgerdemannia flammicorona TaxID=994334 RepID=A0A433D4P0_9FUNG|nr:hypothetical protein BC936DRAFT_147724 [Jimgerdemannia flammicorona]
MVNMEEISDTESSNEESGSDYDEVSTSKKTPTPQKRKNPPAPSTPSSVKPKKPKTNLSKSAASSKEDTSALTPTSKPTPKSGSSKSANTDGRSVDDIYKKKTQVEHILLRPDTYIGAVEAELKTLWVYDSKADCMVLRVCDCQIKLYHISFVVFNIEATIECRPVNIVPGLYKIFDEILVNAADNKSEHSRERKGHNSVK